MPKSKKPKTNPWSEKQFEKSKVKGNEELWKEAAEAIATPITDEDRVKVMLTGRVSKKNYTEDYE